MSSKIRKIVADFETQLSASIAVDDVSFTIASTSDDDGVTIANGQYCFTINAGGSNKEYLVGTLDAVTGIVTNVKSVSRQGGETTGANLEHRVGETVGITNFVTLLDLARQLGGEDSLDADNPVYYDAEPTLSQREEVATKGYVDDIASGGDVSYAKLIVTGNAGETLIAGDVVYFDTTDQEWKLADADTAYSVNTQLGIAQGAGTDGNSISNGVLIRGTDVNQTGLTPGASYYISETAGDITSTAPTNDIFVGVAKSSIAIIVNFENRIIDYVDSDDVTQAADLQTQTDSTNSIENGEADATTKKNKLYQTFVASKSKIRGVKLFKKADTGSFTGTVTVALYADSSGSPTGSALATVTITNANWLLLSAAEFEAIFTSEYSGLVAGTTYGIQVTTSTSDNSNHPNFGGITSGGSGLKYNNTTDGWVTLTNSELYYKTMEGIEDQVVKTGDDGFISGDLIKLSVEDVSNPNITSGLSDPVWSLIKSVTLSKPLKPNEGFRIRLLATSGAGSSYNMGIQIKLNNTAVFSIESGGLTAITRGVFECYVVNTAAGAQIYNASLIASQGTSVSIATQHGTSAISTGTSDTIEIRGYTPANNDGDDNWTANGCVVERIKTV